jgi:hypothetical protein
MDKFINRAEEFVYRICRKSFFSLWSYANPRGKGPAKELCDILVVFDKDIIIFSVKEVKPTNSGDILVDWTRWQRRVIEGACKQIYGAERWILSAQNVIRKDGELGLPFPKGPQQRIHRIVVALGSKGKVPIKFGDFGKGFVHVFDEMSFNIIMEELDTISDFAAYLNDKENLYQSGIETLLHGAEEDLLALYLHGGRKFPTEYDQIILDDTLWTGLIKKEEYKAKKIADMNSYVWDRLIEILCEDTLQGRLEFGRSLTETEICIRTMAQENRFSRRILGKSYQEFIELSSQKKIRSRMSHSPCNVVYVFLAAPRGEKRQSRITELGLRCFVARGLNKDCKTVVGIATEQYELDKEFSLDLVYLYMESLTDEDQNRFQEIQKELGYFRNPMQKSVHEDEYPTSGAR